MEFFEMSLPVSLRDVVGYLTLIDRECCAYINRKTGDICIITDEELYLTEDEDDVRPRASQARAEQRTEVGEILASEDYIALPDSFEIDIWSMMREFAAACEDPDQRTRLLDALRGRSASRRFTAAIDDMGMREAWLSYRAGALEAIAINFLKANQIPFRAD
jgi:hypothetical protein